MPREIIRYGGRVGQKMNCPELDGPPAEVIRYSRATVASPGATYHVQPHKEPRPPVERYSTPGMLRPDDIRQIVEALESLDWVVFVKSLMAAHHGNNGSTNQPLAPVDRDEAPREKYARDRMEAQQLRREARRLDPSDREYSERYERAKEADTRYRASREAIASRILDYATRNGCSWDEAVLKTGEQLPMPLLGPPV